MKILLSILLLPATLYSYSMLQAQYLPIITLSHQELYSDSQELTSKLQQAARQGFFYLEIPEASLKLIPAALQFANTFYKSAYLKNLSLPGYSGYKDRVTVQAEGFYCEQSLWQTIYSPEVAQLAEQIKKDADTIVLKVLKLLLPKISVKALNIATSNLLNGNGLYHFSFKHYRPEKNMIGLSPHRDFGYITILYIDKEGLHAKINDIWQPIAPKHGYYVVNFGSTFEILINDSERLQASWHYVEQITQEKHGGDRICFGLYCDNNLAAPLYSVQSNGSLEMVYATYKEFVEAGFKEVYEQPDL